MYNILNSKPSHFVFICKIHLLKWEAFLIEIQTIVSDFDVLNIEEKWAILISEFSVSKTAKYFCEIYDNNKVVYNNLSQLSAYKNVLEWGHLLDRYFYVCMYTL